MVKTPTEEGGTRPIKESKVCAGAREDTDTLGGDGHGEGSGVRTDDYIKNSII